LAKEIKMAKLIKAKDQLLLAESCQTLSALHV
jgi:hypothetical protein